MHAVGARIRSDIISGVLAPGTKLRETALAKQYAVSRIPVREALRSLEAEGLVESRPYVGSVVAPSPIEDAEDLFEIRIVLESATARRAAKRAAALADGEEPDPRWRAVRKEINDILKAGEVVIADGRFEELAVLNMRFHFAIAELSGSLSLISLLRQISGKIEWLYSLNVSRRGSRAWPEHRAILAAIDAGQEATAAELMGEHVGRSRDAYFAMMAETAD
ncbi:GntR family transcriptional regulator [Brevibacterium casei]|uniref:GntR family transcriptional regulator n=2 Tax=Brevibacterium casei TaxID=33889 RepID=K9AEQ4_9MICO|nr:GntR family transcriptional regulator [Brevibacterium casei]EKU45794.1 GntR family transcriptional regulator [Brevibacterium casei S18]KZE24505.1 GntR family transcriptional regulator [Brevibacterium casei]MCT1446811.1 GntR family transcriptional regulator [Brevibacterium casei]MCT2358361.1 GntR family transcriptional regulator [Brevibacterium casei]MDH5147951.1 GntR family transcriptional regulator [Brevibacterium casei]